MLKKAYEIAPDNGRIARGLAKDLLYSEQLDEALKLYQQLTAEEPRDPQLPLSIAEIYRAKHDLAKAREWFNKAKAIDAENLEIRYEEVKLLEAENKNDQALTALKAMLDDTARRTYSRSGRARPRHHARRVRDPVAQPAEVSAGAGGVQADGGAARRCRPASDRADHRYVPAVEGLRLGDEGGRCGAEEVSRTSGC